MVGAGYINKNMKFLIVNSFHRDDKGDAALLHVLIDQLLSIDPSAEISVASMEDPGDYPTFYLAKNIGSFELHSSSHMHRSPFHHLFKIYIFLTLLIVGITRGKFAWLFTKDLRKIYKKCHEADLVISVGGGYFITKTDLGSRMHLLFALQTLVLCKQLGRKVVTAPVSVGPFQKSFEAKYTAYMLSKIDLVLLREDISKKYFVDQDGNLPPNIQRAPDSGFAFLPVGSYNLREIVGAKEGELVLALSVRHWMTPEKQEVYEQAHADLIDYIAEKYPYIKPVFVPQCTFPHVDDDDRAIGKKILEKSKSKNAVLITEAIDYQKVKLAYRQADMIVGTRFHAMVFGLSYHVPGIAIEYEHKTRGIMRDLGLEDWVINIKVINSKILIDLFDRLVEERAKYKQRLLRVMTRNKELENKPKDQFISLLKNKFKILHVINTGFPEGGAQISVVFLLEAFKAKGYDVKVFSSNIQGSDMFSDFQTKTIPPNSYFNFFNHLFYLPSYLNLRKTIKIFKPDIVHYHTIMFFSPSIIFASHKIPSVMTIHGPEEFTFNLLPWVLPTKCYKKRVYDLKDTTFIGTMYYYYILLLQRPLYLFALKRISLFIAPSKYLADCVKKDVPKEKVCQIYNGIKLPKYKELTMNNKILFVGRLEKVKGVHCLIEAFSKLSKSLPDAELHIVGDGSEKNNLIKLSKKLDVSDKVNFKGWVKAGTSLEREYQNATVVVIPSIWPENLPTVCIEAFAIGRPVIGSKIGGIPELVKDGETGYTFPVGDINALHFVLNKILTEKENLGIMSKKACQYANLFNITNFINKIEKVYEKIS